MTLLLALLACAGGEPVYGALVEGERLDVVDMHLHSGEWELIPEATQAYLASNFPSPFDLNPGRTAEQTLSLEGILEQLDGAGARRGVLLAVYAPRTVGVATNELVLGQVAEAPERVAALVSLRVDRWTTDQEAELTRLREALGQPGAIGIKLAHAHQHFRFDDPAYFGIYEVAAEYDAPVYLHTGPSPFPGTAREAPYTDPAYLEAAIAAHPDTQFILGHIGYDFVNKQLGELDTCVRLAQAYPNVWLEPSALGSRGSDPTDQNLPEAYRRMKEGGVADRILYGSDGPQSPGFLASYLERSLTAMQAAGYSRDEQARVLSGAFDEVFTWPE